MAIFHAKGFGPTRVSSYLSIDFPRKYLFEMWKCKRKIAHFAKKKLRLADDYGEVHIMFVDILFHMLTPPRIFQHSQSTRKSLHAFVWVEKLLQI